MTNPGTGRTKPVRPAGRLAAAGALLLIVSLLVTCFLSPAGNAAEAGKGPASGRRVLLVVIDRIGIDDIVEVHPPNIERLASLGSAALMNTRARYDIYGLGSYVVIGAGGRAFAGNNAGLAFNTLETLGAGGGQPLTAGEVYRSRTGRRAPPGSVVNLYIEEMVKKSDTALATSTPGLLGEALREAGRRVAVFGNADSLLLEECTEGAGAIPPPDYQQAVEPGAPTAGHPLVRVSHREVSCIAMDANGLVPAGDVSTRMDREARGPGLLSTDFERLIAEASAGLRAANLVVVDTGQTSRVDEQSGLYSERALLQARRAALLESDRALGELMESVDLSRDLVVLCTPTPSREMVMDGDLFTPLIIAGPGFNPGGSLTSPTTRRDGLVSSFDIAPTVLEHLEAAAPADMEGGALSSTGSGLKLEALASTGERAVYASDVRAALVKLFAISGLVVLLLLLLLSLVRRELIFDHPYFWSVVLLALLSAPLVYMLVPLLPVRHLAWSIAVSAGCELAAGALAVWVFSTLARSRARGGEAGHATVGGRGALTLGWALPRAVLLLSGLTLTVVLIDPFVGSPMSAVSPFGTSLVLGGRYYGIGNIYMGVALGAAILVACLVPDVFSSRFADSTIATVAAGALLLVTIAVIGYPRLGANVGGLVTGVAASFVTLMKLRGGKVGWKQAVLIAAVVIACLVLLLVVDALLPGSTSHAGKAVSRIKGSGISDAFAVIARKLEANYRLILTSVWRLFFLAAVIAALVWRWNLRMFREIGRAYPHMAAAWTGMAVAMAAALVFNDTGIEAAGAIMIYFILPAALLLLSIGKPVESESPADPEAR